MKKLLFIGCMAALAACNDANNDDKKETAGTTEAAPAKASIPDMPYKLSAPYKNWQPGDQKHALTALTSLKAWENGDMAKSMEAFADTVEINFDNWVGRYSKDSLAKQMGDFRASLSSTSIKMEDWESVIAEDKSEEWVTMWYKQIMTDKKGKTDSMFCVNDAKIVNGKIVQLNEAVRHYPAKK